MGIACEALAAFTADIMDPQIYKRFDSKLAPVIASFVIAIIVVIGTLHFQHYFYISQTNKC
jgi:hypothetical protein